MTDAELVQLVKRLMPDMRTSMATALEGTPPEVLDDPRLFDLHQLLVLVGNFAEECLGGIEMDGKRITGRKIPNTKLLQFVLNEIKACWERNKDWLVAHKEVEAVNTPGAIIAKVQNTIQVLLKLATARDKVFQEWWLECAAEHQLESGATVH